MRAELINFMGGDIDVSRSARVSFDKKSSPESIEHISIEMDGESKEIDIGVVNDKDKKLISYLAKHNHFTPFTHPQITLRETVPIFVARQRFKHVVGFTYNEVSRRYVDDVPEFYFPEVWRSRPDGSVKQGSGDIHPESATFSSIYSEYIKNSKATYENMIACGVAPEQARIVLPQSMYTSYYVTGSLAAFARAYNLRKDPHAQKEIQDLADEWDRIIRPLYPVSWEALTKL